jgi:hypothetical protein
MAPDSAKRRLLSDLVARALLAEHAQVLGYDREPGYAGAIARAEVPILTDALFRDQVGGTVQVSDAEVREFYRQRGVQTRVQIMFISDRPRAERALRELRAGADLAQVADRYSLPGMVPPGGDAGFITPGGLLDPLDDAVRTRPIGSVSEPMPMRGHGFVIFKVLERRPSPQPPFEQEAARLREMLNQRKQRAAAFEILDHLKQQYAVGPVQGGSQFLFQKFTPLRAPAFLGRNAQPAMPDFSEEEMARPLVAWRGGSYAVRQALDDLQSAQQRPSLAVLPEIQEFVMGYALQHVAVAEAKRRGLHLAPATAARLGERADEWLVNRLYERAVVPRAVVSAEALDSIYRSRRDQLVRTEEARVRYVVTRDQALAEQLAGPPPGSAPGEERSVAPADFAARAKQRGAHLMEERVDVLAHPPRWSQFEELLGTMNLGEVAGPFQVREGWIVFQLVDRRGRTPDFEELDPYTQRALMSEALDQSRRLMLGGIVDSLRAVTRPYELFPARLRALSWPAQPTSGEGPRS